MAISTFDLFKIGIGPSSSHTVGPMRAAAMFVGSLRSAGVLRDVARIKAEMYGSLGATGRGHGTPKAIMLGLEGERPQSVDVDAIPARIEAIRKEQLLRLNGDHPIAFNRKEDLLLYRRKSLPLHPNGMRFTAYRSSDVNRTGNGGSGGSSGSGSGAAWRQPWRRRWRQQCLRRQRQPSQQRQRHRKPARARAAPHPHLLLRGRRVRAG